MQEYVARSWYEYSGGDKQALHPWQGETNLKYTGPRPPYEHLDVEGKYSWLKTPRWKNHPMEVGPLARLLVAYASGSGEVKEVVDGALKALDVPVTALFSTLGRTAARGLETKLIARWAKEFYAQLLSNIKNGDTRMFDGSRWDPATWPAEAKGVGMSEAPRRALAHWIVIKNRKIENYQLVVPTTWNASPRDSKGQMSSYEAALIGTPVKNPEQPLELLRTIHSFDPCLACAVHLYDPQRPPSPPGHVRLGEPHEHGPDSTSLRLGVAGPVLSLDQRRQCRRAGGDGLPDRQPAGDSKRRRGLRQLLVRHRAFLPLCRRLRVFLQLPLPSVLGLRGESLRPMGQLHPAAAGQVAGGAGRAEGRRFSGASASRWIRSATMRWPV